MRKFVSVLGLLLLSVSFSYALSESCRQDCSSVTRSAKQNAERAIQRVYDELISKLENELVPAYDNYQKALQEQNELLQKVQTLKERNTLLEKQILFLRKQDKELISLSVDSISVKKEVQ